MFIYVCLICQKVPQSSIEKNHQATNPQKRNML